MKTKEIILPSDERIKQIQDEVIRNKRLNIDTLKASIEITDFFTKQLISQMRKENPKLKGIVLYRKIQRELLRRKKIQSDIILSRFSL
ncbi:MAG: hypothetical protein J7L07_05695 [Candidatus Odinarchaeota archaeon]|nr:hypothetical protein [Candidatus Odinarchaeota archaeon]